MTEKLLKNIIKESIKKILLNEISIKDKYQKEQSKLNMSFGTFEQLCNLDPTTKPNKVGKYVNWIIAKYNPNADLRKLHRCLEWYSDGAKRGILTRYNIPLDINQYKSYDEFISTMDSLSDNNDTSMSQSEYNNRQKLEGQFEVLGSTSFYDIVAPKTYAAERYFGSNTEWCTVANERYFDSYSRKGQLYIIYPKNGDSEYKMQFHFEDEQFANKYDEVYDRPMDCIQQVVKDEGVERDLVVLCKKVFSKYKSLFVSFNERLEDAKQRLLNGESPEKIFNYVGIFSEGYAVVFLNSKWNFINTNGEFLSDTWFDGCGEFHKGLAKVCLNYKENYINTNGELISDTWFDDCREFPNGVVKVELDGKENYINTNGRLLSDTWFDRCGFLRNGFAVVELNRKYNLVNTNGELISDTWFDKCRDFDKGFASVKLNGKWNFINANGELLSDTWFNKCGNWSGAVAPVELNGKWNYIDITGKLLTNTWFDWCGDFDNGFALIKLNGKYNVINRSGKILSDTWFDECGCWYSGIGRVKVNGEEYEIETNGDGKLYDRNGKLIQKNIRNSININENKKNDIMKITEKQLKNIIKNVINERSTSWDSFEFAEQNRKAKELKKKLLAQKNGEGAEVKPKKTRQTSVKDTENVKSYDLYREITDELYLRFMDGGKNLPNDSTIKSLLNFYRTTHVVGAKNNASGGAFLTLKNRDKKENMEKYSSFYKAVDAIDKPIRRVREILREASGKKLDNQQLEKIKYEIQDLHTALSMYVSELLQHDFVSKGDSNFVTGNGGHYLGFKTVLKQLKKDVKNAVYLKLVNKIEEIIKNGKDPLSYRIVGESKNDTMKVTEKQLRKIIRESLQEILSESRFSDNEERSDMNNLAKSIVADLKALNFEERGHEIHVDTQDEYEPYVAVYYMNVPSNADCREIAKKHNCYFYVDNSWDIGVFDLTQEYVH